MRTSDTTSPSPPPSPSPSRGSQTSTMPHKTGSRPLLPTVYKGETRADTKKMLNMSFPPLARRKNDKHDSRRDW
ncbi:hypothetical protein E2C01_053949 [Portunus trituberculatus]|uniref:Uncharacterized protein n=1 Tax=Portunus trituberculatus TaxID=210409 RepID=A0A5B7GS81_PORTR|nr:hypothetical protein [Portunus trituberculatus]